MSDQNPRPDPAPSETDPRDTPFRPRPSTDDPLQGQANAGIAFMVLVTVIVLAVVVRSLYFPH